MLGGSFVQRRCLLLSSISHSFVQNYFVYQKPAFFPLFSCCFLFLSIFANFFVFIWVPHNYSFLSAVCIVFRSSGNVVSLDLHTICIAPSLCFGLMMMMMISLICILWLSELFKHFLRLPSLPVSYTYLQLQRCICLLQIVIIYGFLFICFVAIIYFFLACYFFLAQFHAVRIRAN